MEEVSERAQSLWRKAEGVLASGLWSLTRGTLRYPGGLFPLMAERGEGCRVVDTSGQSYTDWIMGTGTSLLGYRHPEVEAAVIEQLRTSGPLLSMQHPIEAETARLIRELVPCAEAVAFGKNGSDALCGAVRVARAVTGRDGIVFSGFHGFHDWYMASQPWCEGVPDSARHLVTQTPFNDIDSLRALFEKHPEGIAAVVLEPSGRFTPEPGYLEAVRELTLDHDTLLVFDEVITGFRLARGGAQEALGVVPDLACLGKVMGNGMPLSAVVGKRELMVAMPRVGYGMTYRGEMLSLAAAKRCLEIIRDEPVNEHVHRVGQALSSGFHESCARHGVQATLHGPPERLDVEFHAAGGITPVGLLSLFVQELLKRKVLTNGVFFPSYAHRGADVEATVAAIDATMAELAAAIDAKSVRGRLAAPPLRFYFQDDAVEEEAAT